MVSGDRLDEIERELERVSPSSSPHEPPDDPTPEELSEWYQRAVKNPAVDTDRAQSLKLKIAEEQGHLTPLPELEQTPTFTEKVAAGEVDGFGVMTVDAAFGSPKIVVPADDPHADDATADAESGPADADADSSVDGLDLPDAVSDRLDDDTHADLPDDIGDDVPDDPAESEIEEIVKIIREDGA